MSVDKADKTDVKLPTIDDLKNTPSRLPNLDDWVLQIGVSAYKENIRIRHIILEGLKDAMDR